MSATGPISEPPGSEAPYSDFPEEVALDEVLRFDDLVDRKALQELSDSFFVLFGIPVRIYTAEGALLAGAAEEHAICAYVNTGSEGARACGATVDAVKSALSEGETDVTHPCFTGQHYRILSIDYEGRRIGRMILGPYAPPTLVTAPESLIKVDKTLDPEKSRALLAKVPKAKPETITRIATHLRATLDLILFSGHKAHVTSAMHLASVRESYRELVDKNHRLQEAYDRLRELDRLKSNFLATVSHELRTPLTSIIGYSEMLSEGIAGELSGEQLEFVRTIHEKGTQLLSLIQGLLDLSKLESGTMKLRHKTIRIEPILKEVVSTVSPVARKKGVAVAFESDDKASEIHGDPERLRQVFINLTDNALKFTPEGGSVTLRARTLEGDEAGDEDGIALFATLEKKLEVRVVDTGIGIPEAERAKVFDAFYQVDSSSTREYGGTGLGLSIVKRLVEGHGGTIHIEANEPTGAVFVVTLPVATGTGVVGDDSAPGLATTTQA